MKWFPCISYRTVFQSNGQESDIYKKKWKVSDNTQFLYFYSLTGASQKRSDEHWIASQKGFPQSSASLNRQFNESPRWAESYTRAAPPCTSWCPCDEAAWLIWRENRSSFHDILWFSIFLPFGSGVYPAILLFVFGAALLAGISRLIEIFFPSHAKKTSYLWPCTGQYFFFKKSVYSLMLHYFMTCQTELEIQT